MIIYKYIMLNIDKGFVGYPIPQTVFSPAHWIPFDIYEWLPRFPRYAPNAFLLNHPFLYYYNIAWHSKYQVQFPHTYGYRFLRAVVTNNLTEIVTLLENKFPIDQSIDKKYGYNALQIASIANNFPLIELLLLRGAQINKADQWGNTPLILAAARQNHEAVHSLLRNGADTTLKNKYGFSATEKATYFPSIQEFIKQFENKSQTFPQFKIRLRVQSLLKHPFWNEVKKMKIYTGKVIQHPLNRWSFDFTDYREISQLKK